jgi:hypothetical protein
MMPSLYGENHKTIDGYFHYFLAVCEEKTAKNLLVFPYLGLNDRINGAKAASASGRFGVPKTAVKEGPGLNSGPSILCTPHRNERSIFVHSIRE